MLLDVVARVGVDHKASYSSITRDDLVLESVWAGLNILTGTATSDVLLIVYTSAWQHIRDTCEYTDMVGSVSERCDVAERLACRRCSCRPKCATSCRCCRISIDRRCASARRHATAGRQPAIPQKCVVVCGAQVHTFGSFARPTWILFATAFVRLLLVLFRALIGRFPVCRNGAPFSGAAHVGVYVCARQKRHHVSAGRHCLRGAERVRGRAARPVSASSVRWPDAANSDVEVNHEFSLGVLRHYNCAIYGVSPQDFDLRVRLLLSSVVDPSTGVVFEHILVETSVLLLLEETVNRDAGSQCKYPSLVRRMLGGVFTPRTETVRRSIDMEQPAVCHHCWAREH